MSLADEVLAEHRPEPDSQAEYDNCSGCGGTWPCESVWLALSLKAAEQALEELERRATTGVWSAGKPDTNVSNWKLAATIRDALTAQGERAYEQGAQDVLYIRCMEHREVPQYNRREINGSECAACAVEEATNGPEHAVRCIGCGRTEDELHAPDCSHINGTAQQGERVAEAARRVYRKGDNLTRALAEYDKGGRG